jgi:nicotinamidase-related amidase
MRAHAKALITLISAAVGGLTASTSLAENIVQEWSKVSTPPPPELKPVAVDPRTTALLMLDFMNQSCGQRPRCVASLPAVQKFLSEARSKGATVVHSITASTTMADIRSEVAAAPNEPWVQSGPDKFLRTDLEKILKDRGIETVIVAGTAAHGAVLYTASGAALRGMRVIVPVDAISSEPAYPEQYTAWHLTNAPGVGARTTLTQLAMITF